MVSVIWIPLILQLVVPAAMLAFLAFLPMRSLTGWVLCAVSAVLYVATLSFAGLWLALPWYTPAVYGLILLFVMALSLRRMRQATLWPRGRKAWAETVIAGITCAVVVWTSAEALEGRRMPASTVDLSFPLRSGSYLVLNGGSNSFLNAHFGTLGANPRYRNYRGQSYGVDLAGLNSFGFRASGLLPGDLHRYSIFGDSIVAPCTGEIIQAVDGLSDLRPPLMDRAHMAGNHVLMKCRDAWILLGHMQLGSVRVAQGQAVLAGDWLGRVGNTGNTAEPHLHIHAQTPGTSTAPLGGEPLHIRFDGKFPRRNDRFVAR